MSKYICRIAKNKQSISVLFVIIILCVLGLYLLGNKKMNHITDIDTKMYKNLEDLTSLLNSHLKDYPQNETAYDLPNLGISEPELTLLKDIFLNKYYLSKGFLFLVDIDGNLLIHPNDEGKNIFFNSFFCKIVFSGCDYGKVRYDYDEKQKMIYYHYYKPLLSYIAINVNENDMMMLDFRMK